MGFTKWRLNQLGYRTLIRHPTYKHHLPHYIYFHQQHFALCPLPISRQIILIEWNSYESWSLDCIYWSAPLPSYLKNLFLQVNLPGKDPLTGRIVNLGITCTLPDSTTQHFCLLFKLEGETECKFYSDVTAPKTNWASKHNCLHSRPVIFGITNSSLAISYSEPTIDFSTFISSWWLSLERGNWFIKS